MHRKMDTDSPYKLEALANHPEYGLIKLKSKVLGGSDALEFTSALQGVKAMSLKAVIADLSDVSLINSTGLGMLVGAVSSLRNSNTAFALINIPPKVSDLLTITHLDKVFKCYSDISSAIEGLRAT